MKYTIRKDDSGNLYLERPIDYDVHLKTNIFSNKVVYPVIYEDLYDIQKAIEEYLSKH